MRTYSISAIWMKIMNYSVIKKAIVKFKIETPKIIWIDEFNCLRPKAHSFRCKNDNESKNKLKGMHRSQSKRIKFEEYKECLLGEE